VTLNLDEVSVISRAVVEDYRDDLEVIGVAAAEGGIGRVELLVTISGCHREPCMLMLNLTRVERATLESELRTKLREALAAHTAS
jgi:hypothetical protein